MSPCSLSVNHLPHQSRRRLLPLLGACFVSFATMLASSSVTWNAQTDSMGFRSTYTDRWFGVFYAVPLVLVGLPLSFLVGLRTFRRTATNSTARETSILTTPSQPSALQTFAQARAATRGDRDLSFLKLTSKSGQRAEEQSKPSLILALVYHIVMIVAL